MLLSDTRGAPGEFPLQACPRLAACGGGTGWGGATSGVGLPPKPPSASTARGWSRASLLRSAAVQLEELTPALPAYSERPASGAHLRTLVRWLCVVVPLKGDSEVYVARRGGCGVAGYALWEWLSRCPRAAGVWLYNPTRAALPPPVDSSTSLADLLRGTLCGQACLAPRCNQRELSSTRAPDLLPERRVPTARCNAAPGGPGTTHCTERCLAALASHPPRS